MKPEPVTHGPYTRAADLWRAILAAAALAPDDECAHTLDDFRPAEPGERPDLHTIKLHTGCKALEGGRWVDTPNPDLAGSAAPMVAVHGPQRPAGAMRARFTFCADGARASLTVKATRPRLLDLAETVRKGWALYGGGPKPAELTRQAGPRKLATWPAAVLKAWRLQLQEPDHVGAMLTGAQLGAVYFPAAGSARAVALAAPVQVAGLPDDLCSALRDDGRWVVSCMLTGKAIGRTGYGSRATAEREALAEWARVGAEKAAGIVARARADGLADPAAGRAAWCQAHGIEDPAAPEGLAMATEAAADPRELATEAAPGSRELATKTAQDPGQLATETAADPAPVAPADGLAHAEAAHLAAACLQRFGVSDLAACEHLASFAAWRLETLRAYRAGCVDAARAAWRESHAEPVGARLRAALAALREITPPDAAALAALAAAPAAPAAPAAAPRGAGPMPPPVAPIEDTPSSTNRGDGQALAWQILAARPMAIYCTAPRIIGVHEWACVVYISEIYGPCTDYVWRRVSSARAGGPFEGGRFFPGREWPTYDNNRGNHGQPQTLARLYAGNREAIAAALDDGRAGRLPDWAGPAHAAALQSWREWEQRRAAMLRAPIVARPPAPARPIEPAPVAPDPARVAYADRRHAETGRRYLVTGHGHAMLDCADNRRTAADLGGVVYVSRRPCPPGAPAWMDAPRAAVYRAHVATARTAEELAPGPCGPCLDNPRQWLRRPGLAPAAHVSAVMVLRLRVARAVLKARAERRTGPPPALDLLAKVATSRSGSARQVLALQAAGWIRQARDGWIDLTPGGCEALQAAGFTWRSRGGWMAGGAPHDPPPSAPIEGPPDSTSLEAAAAPDLATMRAAGEMAERLATMARAAAGPDLKRQARMLRSEAARIRAPRAGIAPAIGKRGEIAASMLEYAAQVLADQAAAPGAVRAAAPAAGPGFKPAAWRSCTAPARRGGQVRARRAWHAARHPVATGPPRTAAPRVAPV